MHISNKIVRLEILFVDLRDFFTDIGSVGVKTKKCSKNEDDQLTGHFQRFFFIFRGFLLLISPEQTVKLVK